MFNEMHLSNQSNQSIKYKRRQKGLACLWVSGEGDNNSFGGNDPS